MPATEHPVRYEPTDIKPRPVILTGVGVVSVTLAIGLLMYFVYAPLTHWRESVGAQTPAAGAVPAQLPPEPRLQASPAAEFQSYRAAQMGQLNKYHWTNRDKGMVGIPIQRAMDLIVQRGIPPQTGGRGFTYNPPQAGTRQTGFEGKVEPEPR
jgi:hypothetical protein